MPSSRRDRQTDWVITPPMWPENSGEAINLTSGQTSLTTLALPWMALTFADASLPEWGPNVVLERIRGQILWRVDNPAVLSQNITQLLSLRVRVGEEDMSVAGGPVIPPSYDLDVQLVANENFLWHHCWMFSQWSNWWTDEQAASPFMGNVDVDIRVKRRLEVPQTIQLATQWAPLGAAAGNVPRVQIYPRLRALLSAG